MLEKKKKSIDNERGYLYEFQATNYPIEQVNVLFSYAKSIRGNHYHKETEETFFVLDGHVKVDLFFINDDKSESFIAKSGDEFSVRPYTIHTLEFVEDTTILSFYSKKFDPNDTDIYTLK